MRESGGIFWVVQNRRYTEGFRSSVFDVIDVVGVVRGDLVIEIVGVARVIVGLTLHLFIRIFLFLHLLLYLLDVCPTSHIDQSLS
jgi:hypothetical protein